MAATDSISGDENREEAGAVKVEGRVLDVKVEEEGPGFDANANEVPEEDPCPASSCKESGGDQKDGPRRRGKKGGIGIAVSWDDVCSNVGSESRRFTRLDASKIRNAEVARGEDSVKTYNENDSGDSLCGGSSDTEDDVNFTVSKIRLESLKRRRGRGEGVHSKKVKVCPPPGQNVAEILVSNSKSEISVCLSVDIVERDGSVGSPCDLDEGRRILPKRSRKGHARFSEDCVSPVDSDGDSDYCVASEKRASRIRGRGFKSRRKRGLKQFNPTERLEEEEEEVGFLDDFIAGDDADYAATKGSLKPKAKKSRRQSSNAMQDVPEETPSPRKQRRHERVRSPCNMPANKEMDNPGSFEVNIVAADEKKPKTAVAPGHSKNKTAVPPKNNRERSTEKQKVRDQIKDLLLSYGWTIDLRPRRGRDYLDSVYISPQGSGYWSITKAYTIFQQSHTDKERTAAIEPGTEPLDEHSVDQNGSTSSLPVIPGHLLNMLKRKVMNKRRTKKELEEARKAKGSIVKSAKKTNGLAAPRSRKLPFASKGQSKQGRKKKNKRADSDAELYIPYVGKRTVLSWIIDSGIVCENAKVIYMNQRHTRAMMEGLLKRDGIHCNCCSKLYTVSDFEVHAGSKICEPYRSIFVGDSDLSLAQCQLHAWQSQEESVRCGFYSVDSNTDPNDDTCGICGDGGDLICCDGCPSTFHLTCLGIPMLPPDEWHCSNCTCKFCGIVDGSSTDENDSNSELSFCVQCEKKFHGSCVSESDNVSVDSNACISFCENSCKMIYGQLLNLLGVKNELESGFSWSIIRRLDNYGAESLQDHTEKFVCNAKIAVALSLMDECFLPIVDQRSGVNLIHNVVYNCGSNFDRINFSGFYTFILERGEEMITAASIRIHGARLAEMPFIGTRDMYRRQGMCRRLLSAIEFVLCSFNVEKLVIPAISELEDTWKRVFGFRDLDDEFRQEVKSVNLLVFPGTGLLEKPLLKGEFALDRVPSSVDIGQRKVDASLTRDQQSCVSMTDGGMHQSVSDDDMPMSTEHTFLPANDAADKACFSNFCESESFPVRTSRAIIDLNVNGADHKVQNIGSRQDHFSLGDDSAMENISVHHLHNGTDNGSIAPLLAAQVFLLNSKPDFPDGSVYAQMNGDNNVFQQQTTGSRQDHFSLGDDSAVENLSIHHLHDGTYDGSITPLPAAQTFLLNSKSDFPDGSVYVQMNGDNDVFQQQSPAPAMETRAPHPPCSSTGLGSIAPPPEAQTLFLNPKSYVPDGSISMVSETQNDADKYVFQQPSRRTSPEGNDTSCFVSDGSILGNDSVTPFSDIVTGEADISHPAGVTSGKDN